VKKYVYLLATIVCFVLITEFLIGSRLEIPSFGKSIVTPTPVVESDTRLTEDNLWSLVQNWRTQNGFQAYTKDQMLCDFAKVRIKRVVEDPNLEKFKPGDHYLLSYDAERSPLRNFRLSENVGRSGDPVTMLDSWLDSEAHRIALESDFKYSCIVVEFPYSVQIFSNLEK